MNLILAVFNMAPGFPMDGGRVLRSIMWGVSGNLYRATQLATLVGRGLGYALMLVGAAAFLGFLRDIIDPWSGAWFAILGLFLESSARQSWLQAKALHTLSKVSAEEIMSPDLVTAYARDEVRYLANRTTGKRFIFFVADDDENVGDAVHQRRGRGRTRRGRRLHAATHGGRIALAPAGGQRGTSHRRGKQGIVAATARP
jgi:hypothetical protein